MSSITDLLPEKGWLARYIAYARERVMAPDEFHLACGLAAVSAVAGNAVWVSLGGRRYYGTFWGVLIGPAGKARKSSAMHTALDMVDEVIPGLRLPDDFSREGLLEAISQQPSGVLELDEFGAFLQKASREYMGGVKQDLSRMWDSPPVFSRKTIKSANYRIERPTLTIIGGCPMEDFIGSLKLGDLKQGLFSRFLPIVMDPDADVTYVGMTDDDEDYHASLVEELDGLRADTRSNSRPVVVSAPVKAQWESYDRRNILEAVDAPAELSGWEARRGVWAAKLGILFSIALTGRAELDSDELARADWLIEMLTTRVRSLVDDIPIAGDRDAEKRSFVQERFRLLAKKSQDEFVTKRLLLKSLERHLNSTNELDRIMSVLVGSGTVEMGRMRMGERGPAAVGYRLMNGKPRPYGFKALGESEDENLSDNVSADEFQEDSK